MRRTRAPDNVAVIPAMSDTETGGYYDDGPPATIFSKDDANIIQEELVAIATMKGASLDTTGADRGQCATAVEGARGIEAKSAETAALTTNRTLVAIASTNSTVGEDTGGVVRATTLATLDSLAKGFQSAVIASDEGRAGDTGGNSVNVAVVACERMAAEGNQSAAIASKCTDTNPAHADGDCSAVIACLFSVTGTGVTGPTSAAIASDNPDVPGDACIVLGTDGSTAEGNHCAVIASGQSSVNGDFCATIASANGSLAHGTASAIIASTDTEVDASHSAAIGCDGCLVADNECVMIGSVDSTIAAAGNPQVTVLASRNYDSNTGTAAPAYSVAMGYHATTPTGRSIALEANGGNIYYDGASSSPAADYAEMFANADGSPHAPGRILARAGKAARLAQSGDRILGVVSADPTLVGGSDRVAWSGRYERDEWGARVWETVEVDGVPLLTPKLSQAYDPKRAHVSRDRRPDEWTCVGLLGQLRVAVDASVSADDDVCAGKDGIGTRGPWIGRGAQLECMAITSPFDAARGYAIALCLVR